MTKLANMFRSSFRPALVVDSVMAEILPAKALVWCGGLLPAQAVPADCRLGRLRAAALLLLPVPTVRTVRTARTVLAMLAVLTIKVSC